MGEPDREVGRVRRPGLTAAVVDARMAAAVARADENRALAGEAYKFTTPETAVAFRCECMHPLCSEVVVLTLEEYEIETADPARAVVAASHADVDARTVVKRTSRFSVVEAGSFAGD
jgi:hypothetical protein